MSDRPSLAIAMEDAGIPPAKAEIASVRFDAIHDSMATNRDLFRGETRLEGGDRAGRAPAADPAGRADRGSCPAPSSPRSTTGRRMAEPRPCMTGQFSRLLVVVTGAVFAALRFWLHCADCGSPV